MGSFRFASFKLDLDRVCLHTPSGEVKLRPKSFEVLRYLVQNARRVVTKEEVINTVWSGVTVTEESLTRCISEIRRALGDDGQQIVRTVPKHGYLLDVPAQSDADEIAAPPTSPRGPDSAGGAARQAAFEEPRAPEAIRSVPHERRQMTAMVCSIADLTALAARMDPEDFREAMTACYGSLRAAVERHGGHVARHLADGVLACFGYPLAHEDDAERAGLAATRALGELKIAGVDSALRARAGVATGLVVVGDAIGSAPSAEPALIGETPLLAAQLANLAAPGTVVMSGATRRIVGKLFECRDLAEALKGAGELVNACVVLQEGSIASRFEALRGSGASILVGRGEELDFLVRRWEQAKQGNGRVVLLTGEAGIGKSRIARALQDRLAGEPHTALVYHCSPYHQDTALYPIATQLARAAGIRRNDGPDVQLRKLEAVLAYTGEWSPEQVALFAALLSIPGGDRYPLPDLTPQQIKERTLGALLDMTRRLCAAQPVLAVFEDLHWIDPTSLEQLSHAVEEIPGWPLLLVATARPEFAPPWPNHWHTAAMALTRLAPADAETLIGSITQGKGLPWEVVSQIVARADGVPFFIEELTKTVLESGMLREDADRYVLTATC